MAERKLTKKERRVAQPYIDLALKTAEDENRIQGWNCMSIGASVLIEFAVIAVLIEAGVLDAD